MSMDSWPSSQSRDSRSEPMCSDAASCQQRARIRHTEHKSFDDAFAPAFSAEHAVNDSRKQSPDAASMQTHGLKPSEQTSGLDPHEPSMVVRTKATVTRSAA